MLLRSRSEYVWAAACVLALCGCGEGLEEESENPFDEDNQLLLDKADTGWQSSLRSAEVELTLEADIEGSATRRSAPLDLAQFALTDLRRNASTYMEALEEELPSSDRLSWLVDGQWIPASRLAKVGSDKLRHFKIERVNAIMIEPKDRATLEGRKLTATVPLRPAELTSEAGQSCAAKSLDLDFSPSVYWYLWSSKKSGCRAKTQAMSVTVTKVMPQGTTTYPEYDQLVADGKIEAIVFFGQIGHGSLSDKDQGFKKVAELSATLEADEFQKSTSPAGLIRYSRTRAGLTETVDISTPREFTGLDDYANVKRFDQGVREHEIVAFEGHSILGNSSFWSRPNIYSSGYQLFHFNGCLGYEYYVRPILQGKKDWSKADVISNLIETPTGLGAKVIGAMLNSVFSGAENKGNVSWRTIIDGQNRWAKKTYMNALYGVSGARTNCYAPGGKKC